MIIGQLGVNSVQITSFTPNSLGLHILVYKLLDAQDLTPYSLNKALLKY